MSFAEARVDALPRRTAHAAWALLYAAEQLHMPPTTEEVLLYDEESPSARSTASALRQAQVMGLAVFAHGSKTMGKGEGVWAPTQAAYGLRSLLEDRYLRETARDE